MMGISLAILFLATVLFHGLRATRDVHWLPGADGYRDVALAQTILDGDYPDDYLIAGAWHWYNPLTGALVAAWAWGGGVSVPEANVRMGPYINLLVPIAFFAMVWYATDIWIALTALVSFLFILPQARPAFVTASYSPWLVAPHLMQGFFYLALLLWIKRGPRPECPLTIVSGVMLGIVFLGHTAPAVLLGLTMVISSVIGRWVERRSTPPPPSIWRLGWMVGVALSVAFIVSLPFTISILFRYHLQVVNHAPIDWVWGGVTLENLPVALRDLMHWRTPVILLGLCYMGWLPMRPAAKIVTFIWPALALLLLAYNYLGQWFARYDILLQQVAPGYHFLLYLIAANHVFFGAGLVAVVRGFATIVQRYTRDRRSLPWLRPTLTLLVILLIFGGYYRDFRVWHGFTRDRTVTQKRVVRTDNFAPYFWIRENLEPGAVFLCDDFISIFCVAPAGGRVVASDPRFMSLYVPYEPRALAREAMWDALRLGDNERFQGVAREYGVTHVLTTDEQRDWVVSGGIEGLHEVFRSERYAIYALKS